MIDLDLVSIFYGYPGPPRIAAAERGDIVLGGCTIGEGQPGRGCVACFSAVDPFV